MNILKTIKRLEKLKKKAAKGKWIVGDVSGTCHIDHKTGYHSGPPSCKYDWKIISGNKREKCCVSIKPNLTLIGYDDSGTMLKNPNTAALIAESNNALPDIAEFVKEAWDLLERHKFHDFLDKYK